MNNTSWIERLSNALLREPQDREQLIEILHDAEENHLLDKDALLMMEGVMHVSEMQARDIMVAKPDIIAINHRDTYKTILEHVIASGHSRFPVVGDDPDHVVGLLLAKDLLNTEDNFDLTKFIRPATIVPESKRLDVLLKEFRSTHHHMAIVVDEYGSIAGLVTMEDILEQIVGQIEDETDKKEPEHIEKISDSHYNISALTPIEEFNKQFNADLPDDEFDTIGGLLLAQFDHIPKSGEQVELGTYHFTITKSDERRIINCHVKVGAAK